VARCSSSSIVQAIDGAVSQEADIVNMSLGTSFSDHIVSIILEDPVTENILFLAPAGNDAELTTLSFPASHPRVISVAGELEDGSMVPNSRVASQADLILPSHYVLATLPDSKVGFMTGTSMASAEASGLFAILHPDLNTVTACRDKDSLVLCLAGLEK
jgi:subtilisin family serine protease